MRLAASLGISALITLAPPTTSMRAGLDVARTDTVRVTVDGHRMALVVSGTSSGPTIVLEPGGGPHGAMHPLADSLAQFARVVRTPAAIPPR